MSGQSRRPLRTALAEGYRRRAAEDRRSAAEWDPLADEAWQMIDRESRATRDAVDHVDQLLLDGVNSGPAEAMTAEWRKARRDAFHQAVTDGEAQLDRGEYVTAKQSQRRIRAVIGRHRPRG